MSWKEIYNGLVKCGVTWEYRRLVGRKICGIAKDRVENNVCTVKSDLKSQERCVSERS